MTQSICVSQALRRRRLIGLVALGPLGPLAGCAVSQPAAQFKIGSSVSRSVFIDPSQFGNRRVKLRLRNSSGEPGIDMPSMRSSVESGLRGAGYELAEQGFGVLVDANLHFMNSVAEGRRRAPNDVGFLLGGVAGYEIARNSGGIRSGSGALIGALAGATLQEVIRSSNDYDSYMAVCDVNIGVIRQQPTNKDTLVIGGNRFERERSEPDPTFESFAQRETLKVYVFAGDRRERRDHVMKAIQDRLARIVANLI